MIKLTYILLIIFITSCNNSKVEIEYEYEQKVVNAKMIGIRDCNTAYYIAYTDGKTDIVDFGFYSKFEVCDTVCFKREKDWFWYIVNCDN